MLRLRASTLALALAFSAPLLGCATTGGAGGPLRIEGAVTPVPVSDADFASSTLRLLRDGKPSQERLGLLVGVVRRQLAHAEKRFEGGHDARATDALTGALYLVRAGEGRGEMIDATGSKALGAAVDRLAPRGDEGKTMALLHMRLPTLAAGSRERAQLEEHLAALETWMKETRTGGLMKRVGDDERSAVSRALLEPTPDALEAGSKSIDAWIDGALQLTNEVQQSGRRPEREEWFEAKRAREVAAATLAALFIRHGDARGALEHLDKTSALKVMRPSLYTLLRAAAKSDGVKDWLDLAAAFDGRESEDDEQGFVLDADVRTAALWGASIEAYRRDPKSIDASALLASLLVHYGMPEVAPLVLSDAVASQPSQQARSVATTLLIDGMVDAAENEGPDAARRVFASAPIILAEADKGGARPSATRVRFLMGNIEVRAGNLGAAEPLLRQAVKAEPSTAGYTMLAQVERQSGNSKAALDAINEALRAPDARSAILDVAEANLLGFELYRDANAQGEAKRSLDAALAATLVGREQRGNAATRTRAERLLGRILERYGEAKGAARAFERALSAAAADKPTFGAAMLDAIGRALLRKDLIAARASLKKGLEADVGEDDLVYGALWVQLLERDLKAPADGTVERALHAGSHTQWTAKLTAWASGKITDSDLTTAATSTTQKVEAAFYTAMASRANGDPGAEQRLRAVATSPVIDLLEVQIAREMVSSQIRPSLPGGVALP